MSRAFISALILGGLSTVVGATMGVAAMGTAVSGAVVFGPLGALVGWLVGGRIGKEDNTQEDFGADHSPIASTLQEDVRHVENAVTDASSGFVRVLGAVWNMEMRLLSAIGVMPFMQRNPSAFFVLAVALLAVVMPVGVFFVVTGMAAMNFGVRADTLFAVNLRGKPL